MKRSLCRRANAAKYGEEVSGWASKKPLGTTGYRLWKGNYKDLTFFRRFIRCKVNNGKKVLLGWTHGAPEFP